jgi:glycosyltransferase involved in cell wall biosynthesis
MKLSDPQIDDQAPRQGTVSEDLDVLAFPDYRDVNPYQRELEEGLQKLGVSISTRNHGGRWFPILERVREHGKPDILHVHFFHHVMVASSMPTWARGPVSALISLRLVIELALLRLAGVKLVWTAHDLMNHERHAIRSEVVFKHLIVRYLCNAIILHCEQAAEPLIGVYRLPESIHRKMTVIPHGHFIDEYPNEVSQSEAREKLDIGGGQTVYLFFGWIRRYKNVPLLIETFAEMDTEDVLLLVVGNPRTDTLRQEVAAASKDDPRVRTRLEFVPDEEVQLYMNAADATVLPFRTGQQTLLTSGSALLAMSFRKAVIAPRVGCVASLVDEEGGFAYEYSDRTALLAAMREATAADLKSMGEYNYRKVSEYTWDKISSKTLETYREVV